MAINSLYPGFVKLHYSILSREHTMTIPTKPFQAIGGQWFLEMKNTPGGGLWTTLVDAFAAAIKPLLHTTGTFTNAELWTMSSPTADPVFEEVYNVNVAGTNATAAVAYGQVSMTYRTQGGGLYRFVLLEASQAPNVEIFPPYVSPYLAINTYLIGNTSMVFGRNGGALIAPIRILSKTNDMLRRKYLLDA